MFSSFSARRRPVSALAATLITGALLLPCAASAQGYKVIDHWKVGGEGGWDYLLADSAAKRLYVTHNARVEVIDTTTGKPVGAITGFKSTHGVALNPDGQTGYVSDGQGNAVSIFDRKTLKVLATIPAGTNPDGITYEPTTKTVWAFNGRSNNVSVIDPQSRSVVATIALPGKPEFPAVDGKGTVWVNIEDKNEIVRLDAAAKKATGEWKLEGCESPSGLAFDAAGRRLFSVCDGSKMAVTDANTGKSLGTATIGDGPDAAGYNAKNKLAFSSNGDATLSIINTAKPGFPAVQTVATEKGARTMTFDPATNRIYLVTAQFGPRPAATAQNPKPRPAVIPDSFTVLVVGK